MTDLARCDGLEELLPGKIPFSPTNTQSARPAIASGSLATTAWFQSAMSAEKMSTVLVLPVLSLMPEAYRTSCLGQMEPSLPPGTLPNAQVGLEQIRQRRRDLWRRLVSADTGKPLLLEALDRVAGRPRKLPERARKLLQLLLVRRRCGDGQERVHRRFLGGDERDGARVRHAEGLAVTLVASTTTRVLVVFASVSVSVVVAPHEIGALLVLQARTQRLRKQNRLPGPRPAGRVANLKADPLISDTAFAGARARGRAIAYGYGRCMHLGAMSHLRCEPDCVGAYEIGALDADDPLCALWDGFMCGRRPAVFPQAPGP